MQTISAPRTEVGKFFSPLSFVCDRDGGGASCLKNICWINVSDFPGYQGIQRLRGNFCLILTCYQISFTPKHQRFFSVSSTFINFLHRTMPTQFCSTCSSNGIPKANSQTFNSTSTTGKRCCIIYTNPAPVCDEQPHETLIGKKFFRCFARPSLLSIRQFSSSLDLSESHVKRS